MMDTIDKAYVYMVAAAVISGTGMYLTGNQQDAGEFFLVMGALLAVIGIITVLEFFWNELKAWRGEGE